MKRKNHVGQRFGRLLVIEYSHSTEVSGVFWRCKCDCGKETIVNSHNLRRGHTRSCGCLRIEIHSLEDGLAKKHQQYSYYRRNATKRGHDFCISFEQFDVLCSNSCKYCGNSNRNGIDRIDNNKGYILDNCVPCCWICNSMKKIMTVEQFLEHVKKIMKHQKSTFQRMSDKVWAATFQKISDRVWAGTESDLPQ